MLVCEVFPPAPSLTIRMVTMEVVAEIRIDAVRASLWRNRFVTASRTTIARRLVMGGGMRSGFSTSIVVSIPAESSTSRADRS
ncbi:Uncharacterised protein [Mycobacteroides abscessus subsp. abscessus]|nr:Uncharacterised protein [Mycobacteroides abscessus subsp. abscessus]